MYPLKRRYIHSVNNCILLSRALADVYSTVRCTHLVSLLAGEECNGKEYSDSAPSLSLRHLALAQPRTVKTFAVDFLLSPFSMPYCTIVSNRSIGLCIAPSTRNDGATLFPRYPYISPATAPSRQSSSGTVLLAYTIQYTTIGERASLEKNLQDQQQK